MTKIKTKDLHDFVEKRCLEIIYPKKSVKKMLDENWAIVIGHSQKEMKLEFKMRHPLSFSRIVYCIEKTNPAMEHSNPHLVWEFVGESGVDLFFGDQKKPVQLMIAKMLGYK